MKILLDECVDRRFARELSDHFVRTVPQAGWAGVKNGDLMRLASQQFEIFITVDRNLSYQQDTSQFDIAIVVLRCVSNRYADLQPFGELVRSLLESPIPRTLHLLSLNSEP